MSDALNQSKNLILITILYNLVEGIFALYFGFENNSTSLLSFGLDSFIEISASVIAIWGLSSSSRISHKQAEKFIAYSFLVLIVFIVIKSSWYFFEILLQALLSITIPAINTPHFKSSICLAIPKDC